MEPEGRQGMLLFINVTGKFRHSLEDQRHIRRHVLKEVRRKVQASAELQAQFPVQSQSFTGLSRPRDLAGAFETQNITGACSLHSSEYHFIHSTSLHRYPSILSVRAYSIEIISTQKTFESVLRAKI
jgi:hypothetical protein